VNTSLPETYRRETSRFWLSGGPFCAARAVDNGQFSRREGRNWGWRFI